jgi:hypothetical protein
MIHVGASGTGRSQEDSCLMCHGKHQVQEKDSFLMCNDGHKKKNKFISYYDGFQVLSSCAMAEIKYVRTYKEFVLVSWRALGTENMKKLFLCAKVCMRYK